MSKVVNLADYRKKKFVEDYIKACIAFYGYSKEQQERDKEETKQTK